VGCSAQAGACDAGNMHCQLRMKTKRKENTTPFGVMRSQVIYRPAQGQLLMLA